MAGYHDPEPGEFWWCVRYLDLGDRRLTVIARLVCEMVVCWPEQLVGRGLAWPAVSYPENPPLATGHSAEPSRHPNAVAARRLAWCLAREFTDLPASELAAAFGDFSTQTVYAAWRKAEDYMPTCTAAPPSSPALDIHPSLTSKDETAPPSSSLTAGNEAA